MTSEYTEPILRVPKAPEEWANIGDIAIAIAGSPITRLPDQRHVGLFVRDEAKVLHFVDLGWQFVMGCTPAPINSYGWLGVDYIPPKRAQIFADICIEVARKNRGTFPYSFIYRDDPYFDDLSDATPLGCGEGLSCATFVLEMFRLNNIEILDRSTWRARERDRFAINRALDALAECGPTPHYRDHWQELEQTHCAHVHAYHIHLQREKIEEISRYWPEEVAGAANVYAGTPIECEIAERLGGSVVGQLAEAGLV